MSRRKALSPTFLSLCVLCLSGCGAALNSYQRGQMVGVWKQDTKDSIIYHEFKDDGSYKATFEGKSTGSILGSSFSKYAGIELVGSWALINGRLKWESRGFSNVAFGTLTALLGDGRERFSRDCSIGLYGDKLFISFNEDGERGFELLKVR